MILPWKKLSERVEKVDWRTILHRVFEHPSGREVECTVVENGEGVVTFALTPEGRIILCRHFRPGPEKVLYEAAAGAVEEGEGLFEAAARELLEETGYAGELEYVASYFPWAWGGWKMHVFVARNCHRVSSQKLDDFEVIDVELLDLETFAGILLSGNDMHVAASRMALDFLHWQERVLASGKKPRRVACCLLRDGDRFLFQHRTDDAVHDPGKWGLFGGHLDDDDTPSDAVKTPLETVKREIMEELGYELRDPESFFVWRNDEVEASIFMEKYDDAKPLFQHEGKGMGWYTFEEALQLDFGDNDHRMLEQLRTLWHDAGEERI